jgi:hypothetical protein
MVASMRNLKRSFSTTIRQRQWSTMCAVQPEREPAQIAVFREGHDGDRDLVDPCVLECCDPVPTVDSDQLVAFANAGDRRQRVEALLEAPDVGLIEGIRSGLDLRAQDNGGDRDLERCRHIHPRFCRSVLLSAI